MSRNRLLISAALLLVVAALMAWQYSRHALVTACVADGGMWDGSSCKSDPRRIILQRELQRG